MGILRQLAEYLYIKKKDPSERTNSYTRLMHGMNRISILVFLICLIIMLIRYIILPLLRK